MIDIKEYLKNPTVCPYCGIENITGGDTDFSNINAYRNIVCNECKKE